MSWDDDVDDRPSRTSTTVRRHPPFLPFVMIAIGVAVLFDDVVGNGIGVWTLLWAAVGVWCLARARDDGPYPLLVIGVFIVSGVIGEILGAFVSRGVADAMETLGHAGGFLWLYGNDRGRSRWALIAGAIFGVIGVGQLGFQLTDVVRGEGTGWLLPAGVVVAGILLLGAHRLPGPIRLAGLVFVGAAVLSLLTNPDGPPRRRPLTVTTGPRGNTVALPEIGDRTLRFNGGSGDISVESADDGASADGSELRVTESADAVTIVSGRPSRDIRISVPAGTKLQLRTSSGDMRVDVASASIDLVSASGDITAQLAQSGKARSVVATSSGDVDLTVEGDPSITVATGSGDIETDGFDDGSPGENSFTHSGDDGQVVVTTSSGDVDLERIDGDGADEPSEPSEPLEPAGQR